MNQRRIHSKLFCALCGLGENHPAVRRLEDGPAGRRNYIPIAGFCAIGVEKIGTLLGFVAPLVVFDVGKAEGAAAIRGEDMVRPIFVVAGVCKTKNYKCRGLLSPTGCTD